MGELMQEQKDAAVWHFEKVTAEFVTRYGGVPHCPQCGAEAVPNPLPWVVGPNTWACPGDNGHGDFRNWESRVPPRDWRPTEKHPAYIHEAFAKRA